MSVKQLFICPCGYIIENDYLVTSSGHVIHPECGYKCNGCKKIFEYVFPCRECVDCINCHKGWQDKDVIITTRGPRVCYACAKFYYKKCPHCGGWDYFKDNCGNGCPGVPPEAVCFRCKAKRTYSRIMALSKNVYACNACVQRHYNICTHCDSWVRIGDICCDTGVAR